MSDATAARAWDGKGVAQSALQASAVAWFIPALIGQWLFAYHIAITYIATTFAGNTAAWNHHLFVGLVPGDVIGNIALAAHLFIAFTITIGGTLQLIPQIRSAAPAFHRWNGRLYILTAFITSIAALYMVWTRDTFGPDILEVPVSINGVLIMIFAAQTWRFAMAKKFDVHHRWALRTFMVVSGVWFLRVMYPVYAFATGGAMPGVTDDMSGPVNVVVGYASFLLPLAMLELYFAAKRSPSGAAKVVVAALVFIAAAATAVGVYGASTRWLAPG